MNQDLNTNKPSDPEDKSKKRILFIIIICLIVVFTLTLFIYQANTKPENTITNAESTLESEQTSIDLEEPLDNQPISENSQINTKAEDPSQSLQPSGTEDLKENDKSTKVQTEHTHNWEPIYTTVTVPAKTHEEQYLVKEAWTEYIPIYETKWVGYHHCSECGFTSSDLDEFCMHQYTLKHHNSYLTEVQEQVQVDTKEAFHEAQYGYRTVVDQEAYTKQVISEYRCSCGARKAAE